MAQACKEDWAELCKEYEELEANHKDYTKKVENVKAVQRKCTSSIAHQRYRIKQLQDSIRRLEKSEDVESQAVLSNIKTEINKRKIQFRDMEDVLPHENGVYLKIILGSVNVSLLSKIDKFQYKEDYERFKLILSIIIFLFAIILYFISYRVTDACFQFLLVWYYCTLTIRESILRVNGSRIKGWWITHHFISTFCAGVLLIWPSGFTYDEFRMQFIMFSIYLSLVQFIQYYYQSGMLYRLRALGERRNMDITVEGFQSWMWKGLSFVLPFLLAAYVFQLYNAYTLYVLSRHAQCVEWQVSVLGHVFLVLGCGNTWTTLGVIRQKFFTDWLLKMDSMFKNKYHFNNNKNQ